MVVSEADEIIGNLIGNILKNFIWRLEQNGNEYTILDTHKKYVIIIF